ncbi:hypothetical protein BS47DRAFT_1347688 [Hydnum rufescens UP504]|uniref:Uncharacterized protein n=1 Tax=Hydnum rufescens UP504 TaxID=1448309 RepID=A0A9P6ARH6_9AGAM|nr:hypothetical protein BS47DRAFT_1347688 [Hydnum rufescens UP504]
MYVDISCCVPYCYKFGHILMPWVSSLSAILAKHVDVGLGRQVILPLRRRPRKNELHSPLPLRALMLAAGRVRSKS